MKKPNLLFILSDQHRFCDTGFMGNRDINTPVLDEIANEGAVFDNTYSNCPVCVPARGTLFTGLHALKHGAAGNDMAVNKELPSIARVLRSSDYRTAYIGKWHLGGVPRDQFIDEDRRLGFEYWRGNNCNHNYMDYFYDDNDNNRHHVKGYEPVVQTELVLDYLRAEKGNSKPFAMFVCYSTPHSPYLVMTEEQKEKALERAPKLTLRPNVEEYAENKFVPPEGHHAHAGGTPPWNKLVKYNNDDELKRSYSGYYSHIEALDTQIGRIVEELKAQGVYDDTILIYTSDHGDLLGSHGLWDKQIFYQESSHIPFVIRWPGHIPTGRRKQLLSIVDMAPTVLGLLRLRFDTEIDGIDISACITDPEAAGQEYLYLYNIIPAHNAWHRELGSWRAITDAKYMLAMRENGESYALYDLESDPYEMHDLKDELPEVVKEYADRLSQYVDKNDGYLPWQTVTYRAGLADEWDRSQTHFGFPIIEEKYKI